MKLNKIKSNPKNPRVIDAIAFEKLKESIQRNETFMELRPIIIDEDNVILGGNQRYKACMELFDDEIPETWIKKIEGLTEKQKKEFILLDNSPKGYSGEWEKDLLKEFIFDMEDYNLLDDFGMFDIEVSETDLDSFFEQDNTGKENKNKIILEYTDEEFEMVTEAFRNHSGTKEQIIFKLLGL